MLQSLSLMRCQVDPCPQKSFTTTTNRMHIQNTVPFFPANSLRRLRMRFPGILSNVVRYCIIHHPKLSSPCTGTASPIKYFICGFFSFPFLSFFSFPSFFSPSHHYPSYRTFPPHTPQPVNVPTSLRTFCLTHDLRGTKRTAANM